jgi:hypothetical protein
LKLIRTHLTYANVVATISLFLVLGGATAFAAKQLAAHSVGTRQLKANAVTAAKIKDGAVTGNEIARGTIEASDLAPSATPPLPPPPLVKHTLVATSQKPFPLAGAATASTYAFDNPDFSQAAGEDLLYLGSITATFDANCLAPREFTAVLVEDNPAALGGEDVLGTAFGEDHLAALGTVTAQFGIRTNGHLTDLGTAKTRNHAFSIRLNRIFCGTGSPSTATATATGAKLEIVGLP